MWPPRSSFDKTAPPGVRPPAQDGPADGWVVLDQSRAARAGVAVDTALLRIADGAARTINRRRFLAGTGAAVLAVTIGASGVFRTRSAYGAVCNVLDPNNALAGACGPSPLCPTSHCENSGGSCDATLSAVTWRAYGGCDCVGPSSQNCWTENCCSQYNGTFRCCDCCSTSGAGGQCCGCNVTRRRCICRRKETSC